MKLKKGDLVQFVWRVGKPLGIIIEVDFTNSLPYLVHSFCGDSDHWWDGCVVEKVIEIRSSK